MLFSHTSASDEFLTRKGELVRKINKETPQVVDGQEDDSIAWASGKGFDDPNMYMEIRAVLREE